MLEGLDSKRMKLFFRKEITADYIGEWKNLSSRSRHPEYMSNRKRKSEVTEERRNFGVGTLGSPFNG